MAQKLTTPQNKRFNFQEVDDHIWAVFFFCVVAPIHWETDLREAYASLRGVKGSLRGGVLFGVALRGWLRKDFSPAGLKKSALRQLCLLSQKWLHYLSFWPFVASFPFIFGLLWLHLLLWGTYGWGSQLLTQDLRGGYAVLTRGELVASDKCIQMYSNSQLQGHQILQESQSLMFENIYWKYYQKIRLRKFAYAMIYHPRIREVLTPLTQPCEFSGIALTCAYALFF